MINKTLTIDYRSSLIYDPIPPICHALTAITSLHCRCQFGPADVILHAAASGAVSEGASLQAMKLASCSGYFPMEFIKEMTVG